MMPGFTSALDNFTRALFSQDVLQVNSIDGRLYFKKLENVMSISIYDKFTLLLVADNNIGFPIVHALLNSIDCFLKVD